MYIYYTLIYYTTSDVDNDIETNSNQVHRYGLH